MVTPALVADRAACRGAGQCAFNAPELFDQDEEEGLVVVLQPFPSAEQLTTARTAVDSCPNRAIALTSAAPPATGARPSSPRAGSRWRAPSRSGDRSPRSDRSPS
ncbi:ferredoxin [Actinomadura vinacea]|uniref:ferredoxin n=1 Tax=Actinomadura vinacea TaxID=115336 RepID=UPI0031DA2120